MSKILRVRKVAHTNDFARAIALLGKLLHEHDQIKAKNTAKNCKMEQR